MVSADAAVIVMLRRMINTPTSQQDLYGIKKTEYQVPSQHGQADLIKRAWDAAGLSPGIATYVE